jgi:hypothetical protein
MSILCYLTEQIINNEDIESNEIIQFNDCIHTYLKTSLINWIEYQTETYDDDYVTGNKCILCHILNHIKSDVKPEVFNNYLIPLKVERYNIKPYIRQNDDNVTLKSLKRYIEHGEVLYDGLNYFIGKRKKAGLMGIMYLDEHDSYDYYEKQCLTTEEYYVIPYSYVCDRGITFFLKYKKFNYPLLLQLEKDKNIYYDIMYDEIYPRPRETSNDYYIDNVDDSMNENVINIDEDDDNEDEVSHKIDNLDDEIKEDEIALLNHGKFKINNDTYFFYTNSNEWEVFKGEIDRYYVEKRGLNYYRVIAKEHELSIGVHITPFETIDLKTMEVQRIMDGIEILS